MSVELAKRLDGEIINADSTQVYRGMNIGTAKVTEEEKEGIVHHLFDIKDVEEDYTVYDYQRDCRMWIEDIWKRGKTPILVGGTGLYIKAALYDYQFQKEETTYSFDNQSSEELYQQLKKIDPETEIHPHNRKRIERALTHYYHTGTVIGKEKSDTLLYDSIFIGLTTDREELYERINKRVYQMLDEGLEQEARFFYDKDCRSKAVLTPICYKELFSYFDGKITKEEAIDLIQKNSRHYAKRQYTWFRHQLPVEWFDVDFENFSHTVESVYKRMKELQK